jgi:transcriptional regulator with GAF, ATPase, and Fis domain
MLLSTAPNDWLVIGELGSGASGRALLVEQRSGGDRFVLKAGRSASEGPRLAAEAERLLFSRSTLIPALLDAGVLDRDLAVPGGSPAVAAGSPYIALQQAPGQPLESLRIRAEDQLFVVGSIARDLGLALSLLHASGVAHGDVKPSNVVVDSFADACTARLIDLGLAAPTTRSLVGGATPRYLAPEAFDTRVTSDARARDLWALGLTLAELVDPNLVGVARVADAVGAADLAQFDPLIRPLLASQPGARPSAHWVWRRASRLLGSDEAVADAHERRLSLIRGTYLSTCRNRISAASVSRRFHVEVPGRCGQWLMSAISLAARIALLRGARRDGQEVTVRALDGLGQARWLTALIGASVASWPAITLDDSQLAERLSELATYGEPEAFTLAAIEGERRAASAVVEDPIELALTLATSEPRADVLEAAEAYLEQHVNQALSIALGRALRRRGELGRAIAVLERCGAPLAAAEAAETARRAGDRELSERLLAKTAGAQEPAVRARCAATQARWLLSSGRHADARAVLELTEHTAATLESRALVEIADGRRAVAQRTLDRARLLATSDEDRARVEAVSGNLAHAAADAEQALLRFSAAAELAARAGAVLEEATYLTGVAAAASDVGDLGTALRAARRGTLLFEHLGRPAEAARAALSLAAAHAQSGAIAETEDAARDAIERARAASDVRCRAYAHLAWSDVLADGKRDGLEHVERARSLLGDTTPEDELRIESRRLRRGVAVDLVRLDDAARNVTLSSEARLEWWGARAAAVRRDSDAAAAVVAELVGLAGAKAPTAVRGAALAAGARLSAELGDGVAARRLTAAASQAARELIQRASVELKPAIVGLPWVAAMLVSDHAKQIAPEQITDVETLVRALGRRDRLRPLLNQVIDALVLWTGVERGLLLLRAPGGKLVPRAARNLARSDLTGVQLELSMSLAERALRERDPVIAVDAAGELSSMHASVHALKLRSVLALPLLAHGEALGVVYLDDRVRRGAFGPAELSWVRLIATIAAVAIADARDQLVLRRTAARARRAEARLAVELARSEAHRDTAERELARARESRETRFAYDDIIGRSASVRQMLQIVDRVTASEVPVLVIGESGSGKELVARAIHFNGPRASMPFVSENCAAIPEGLLESTLFGHVRGAFTGASRPRAGLFEVAHRGTLFLDEIADMSLGMQTKLLRVLEEGELRPVGSERARQVDVRVVGATHRNLEAMVATGQFRQDLFYRLNVITIRVPPLRERVADIPQLARYFVGKYAPGRRVRITQAALDALAAFPWPGNIRQLENEVRRALVLADDTVDARHLSQDVVSRGAADASRVHGLNVRQRVDALELELVTAALRKTGGNQTRAAELLGLSRFGLQKMMKRLEISVSGFAGLPPETELSDRQ